MSDEMRISIIGTAGRGNDRERLIGDHWVHMGEIATEVVARWQGLGKKVTLVSGGAAWADHVAVTPTAS